jgi:hypothetical protein
LARDLWRATSVAAALLSPAHSAALCPLPPQRAVRIEAPRLALHFGAPEDVPSHIVTTALADEQAADLCVPIRAFGLGAGADVFGFASGIECGSLATGSVHLPVDSQSRSWGQLKVLYR